MRSARYVNKMDVTESSAKKYYNSLYWHGVDEKRRVQIPSKWPRRSRIEFTLIFWPKPKEGPCLRVMPPNEMEELVREVAAIPNTDPTKVVLKRLIGSGSVQVAVDKVGRICLPEDMARAAGIQDKAVIGRLAGSIRDLEPGSLQKVRSSDAVMMQEAFRIME